MYLFLFMCMHMCLYVHRRAGAHGSQKKRSDPLNLDLHTGGYELPYVILETKLQFERTTHFLNCRTIFQVPNSLFHHSRLMFENVGRT